MSYFTDSLNSQLEMLGLDNRNSDGNPNSSANQIINPYANTPIEVSEDISSLRAMLMTRMKYTKPQIGSTWEFNLQSTDVRYLKDSIKFIDMHCENRFYLEYLTPLEMDCDEIDSEFPVRFYNHLSFKSVKDELIKSIKLSNYDYLSNLLTSRRNKGDNVPTSWYIFPGNKRLIETDYSRFYDIMDDVLKEWLLTYCISDQFITERATTLKMNAFDVLDVICSTQNVSYQIKLLIDLLNSHDGCETYLKDGYLTYLTFVEHLQTAIEKSIPKCKNPYKTAFMLMSVLRGMSYYPDLLHAFEPLIENFLHIYPNFTLGELATFLQRHKMPHLKEYNEKRLLN